MIRGHGSIDHAVHAIDTSRAQLTVVDIHNLHDRAQRFVVERFQPPRGHFTAGTRPEALAHAADHHWTDAAYECARDILAQILPDLREGRSGFDPDWLLGPKLRTPSADAAD